MRALIRRLWRAAFPAPGLPVRLAGSGYVARAVPLGRAALLVPPLVRSLNHMAAGRFDEPTLYADMITVLEHGLGMPRAEAEALEFELVDLVPVFESVAAANGLVPKEGAGPMGKALASRILLARNSGTSLLH